MTLSRRHILVAPFAVLPAFAKKPFWLEKPADQWNPEEVAELMTKSPWAQQVSAQFSGGGMRTGMPGGGGGMGRGGGGMGRGGGGMGGQGGGMPGGGGMGEPGGGGMGGGMPGGGGMGGPGGGRMGGGMPDIKALVRWESAEPLRLARRGDWPAQFEGMYVISVSGLPAMGQRGGPGRADADPEEMKRRMMSQLRESTELRRKGRDAVGPETIDVRQVNAGRLLLFAFAQSAQPITLEEKEVEFRTQMGPLEIRSKFKPKEMQYQGRLVL